MFGPPDDTFLSFAFCPFFFIFLSFPCLVFFFLFSLSLFTASFHFSSHGIFPAFFTPNHRDHEFVSLELQAYFFFFFRVFRGSDAHYLNVHFASHARSLHPFLSFSLLLDINLQSGLF